MSNGKATLPLTPQSPKKRKTISETTEVSKKKRKHDRAENGTLTPQETGISKTDKKKREKKDKKEKTDKKKQKQEFVEQSLEIPKTEDVKLPSAPDDPVAISETEVGDSPAQAANGIDEEDTSNRVIDVDDTFLQSRLPSCFYEKRLSLQLPVPAVALENPTSSILSLHLGPLVLTYFQPAEGIVISFSDPVLSAVPSAGFNLPLQPPKSGKIPRNPPDETFARCADAFGVCWVWLTVTFMVFSPAFGDKVKGWTNIVKEQFVAIVSYNQFQAVVRRSHIPQSWTWDRPTAQTKGRKKDALKGILRGAAGTRANQQNVASIQETQQDISATDGRSPSFLDADGQRISTRQTYNVVDVEMIPGPVMYTRGIQVYGSLLPKGVSASGEIKRESERS